ncbi:MAG TPA: pyruvate dehydrogenase (acetyl-transferring) E1 component subunit alpha [Acidimicrobiia bacterium]
MRGDPPSPLAPAPLPADPAVLLPGAEPVRLLAPDGTRREHAGFEADLDPAGLRRLHAAMVLARRVDTQALHLSRQGRLGVYPAALGQEATEVGSVLALDERDWLFPTYRDTMAAVARGADPVDVLRACRATGYYEHDVVGSRVATLAIPLATQALHAVGLAMAARLRGDPVVVLVFLGDGAASEGDTHEAMNFAGVFGAPVVFLVVNNQYAISTPVARQTHGPSLAHRAVGYGMPGVRVDGNDALAVYAAVRGAVDRARPGGGPTLVECLTYRIEAHSASDDPSRYRTEEEVEAWRSFDPLLRLERYLRAAGVLDDERAAEAADAAERVAARIRAWCDAPETPDPLSIFDHVYASPTPAMVEQRRRFEAELAAIVPAAPEEAPA